MIKISCLIIDDEPLALDLLERYVAKTTFLDLKHKCYSAIDALNKIEEQNIDLIFLDIQMPELTGLEFSRIIKKDTKIIFTTAFHEHAIDSYKVNALDYLLKPFNYEEFLKSAHKAKEWFEMQRIQKSLPLVGDNSYIFIKSEYKQLKINFSEIIYFEGLKDYVKIWLKDQKKPLLTIMSLKSLVEKLPEEKFMRIHRSFIVSLDKVQSIERGQVIMANDIRITIAEHYKAAFQSFITQNSVN